MAKELISIVEGAQMRFQHQQRLLHQAQPALAGGCAEGAGPGYQCPADGVVDVLHQPFVFQAPDVFGEAGSSTMRRFFKILLVVAMPEFPLWVGDSQVGLYIYIAGNFDWMFITSMFQLSSHQINIQMTIGANPNTTLSDQKENARVI